MHARCACVQSLLAVLMAHVPPLSLDQQGLLLLPCARPSLTSSQIDDFTHVRATSLMARAVAELNLSPISVSLLCVSEPCPLPTSQYFEGLYPGTPKNEPMGALAAMAPVTR